MNTLDMALKCQGTFASMAVKASLTEKYLVVVYYLMDVLGMMEQPVWQFIKGAWAEDEFLRLVESKKKMAIVNQQGIVSFWMSMIKVFPGMIPSDELAYLIGKGAGEIEAIWDLLDAMDQYGASPAILKNFVRFTKVN